MARGSKGTPKSFKFSAHPGHGKAGRTAQSAVGQFKNISRPSTGGRTKAKSPSVDADYGDGK